MSDVEVRERVEVTLSKKEATHALRCWVAHQLASRIVPAPATFNNIDIAVICDQDGAFQCVVATYEPAPREPETEPPGDMDQTTDE